MGTSIRLSAGCSVAIATMLSFGCIAPPNPSSTTDNDAQLDVADITDNEDLIGQRVTVRNDIQKILSEKAFTLDEDQVFGGQPVLVVSPSDSLALPRGEETEVRVSGKVELFVRTEMERKYNLTLEPNLYQEYENKPAIIADTVTLSPDPGDVTQNPEAYYDREIAVEGEVEETIVAGVFKLDEEQVFEAEDLLVIVSQPGIEAQNEANVVVIGILRPFVLAEFEQEYELDWDLSVQQQLEAEYANIPVLVAHEVSSLGE